MKNKYKIAAGTTSKNSRFKKKLSKNLVPIRRVSIDQVSTPQQQTQSDKHDERERNAQASLYLQEFVYAISHDLKMPLRAVNGFSNLLAEDYAEQLDDTGKRYIKRILDGAVQLEQLISCVTEFSRISAKEPKFVEVDINDLMKQVIDDLGELIEGTKAVVTYDSLPTVFGDSIQISQLFHHLLENGIRFRSEKPVEIHVSAETCEIGHQFKVSDNGIGIDKKDHEHAFTMFRRIGVQDVESAGLGAGLTICRRIVERHGGQIKLNSEPGAGTQVTFSLATQIRT